jgi:hypothetical protein
MKYDPTQDWRDKIEVVKRLSANIKARNRANRFTPVPLTDAQRDNVEAVTRFEQYRGDILKQHGKYPMVTNR